MRARRPAPPCPPRLSRGVSLIEIAVLLVVVTLWLLATAGLVANSLRLQSGTASRMTVVAMATELGELMEANPVAARSGSYVASITTTPTTSTTNCSSSFCTPAELASYDLAQWTSRLAASIPLESAVVTRAGTTYTITIGWAEPRGRQTYGSTSAAGTESVSFSMIRVLPNG